MGSKQTCVFKWCRRPGLNYESPNRIVRGLCGYHLERAKHYCDPIRLLFGRFRWKKNKKGYVYLDLGHVMVLQHRIVMEQCIGRPLLQKETVHHKNGDRADNRIENLELMEHSHPSGQRVTDKLAWAREFIAQYEGSN